MPLNRDPLAKQMELDTDDFRDERDSLLPIGFSLLVFAAVEYFVELHVESLPGGLIFPFGFLLFWAFYYTYYRPNNLESGLKPLGEMSFPNLFGMVFSVAVWFMKVTVVGLFDLLLVRWWKSEPPPKARPSQFKEKRENTGSYNSYSSFRSDRSEQRTRPEAGASTGPGAASTPPPQRLPQDFQLALNVLGMETGIPTWDAIHKRYRELAKKYHPDLNQEITRAGNRFIKVDQAYRKLAEAKGKFFK